VVLCTVCRFVPLVSSYMMHGHTHIYIKFSLLFIFTFISLLPFCKYLFKLVRETILLFVTEQAVHNFSATKLTKKGLRTSMRLTLQC
jgi:hypothetical protein